MYKMNYLSALLYNKILKVKILPPTHTNLKYIFNILFISGAPDIHLWGVYTWRWLRPAPITTGWSTRNYFERVLWWRYYLWKVQGVIGYCCGHVIRMIRFDWCSLKWKIIYNLWLAPVEVTWWFFLQLVIGYKRDFVNILDCDWSLLFKSSCHWSN